MRISQRLAICLCIFSAVCAAQSGTLLPYPEATKPEGGFMPGRTFNITDLESVSVSTGNVTLQLPLTSLPPGRAGLGGALSLTYNSNIWELDAELAADYSGPPPDAQNRTVTINTLQGTDESLEHGGWQYGFEYKLIYEQKDSASSFDIGDICLQPEAMRTNKLMAVFPDGSRHTLFLVGDYVSATGYSRYTPIGQNSFSNCNGGLTFSGELSYHTTDGSFLQVHLDDDHPTDWTQRTWTMIFPDGRRVQGKGETTEKIYDANGNFITVSSLANLDTNCPCDPLDVLTDQFGRTVTITHQTDGTDVISQKGFANGDKTWTITYDTLSLGGYGAEYLCSNFQNDLPSSPGGDNHCSYSRGLTVITSIEFPGASSGVPKYLFDYGHNNGGSTPLRYGMLSEVELQVDSSTVYTATYEYDKDDESLITYTRPYLWQPRLISKTVTHTPNFPGASSQSETTTYQYFDSAPFRTVATAPDGGTTTHYYRNDSPSAAEQSKNSLVYRIDMPNGDSVRNYWQKNQAYHTVNETGVFDDDQGNPYIRAQYRMLCLADPCAQNFGPPSAIVYTYDKNGNILQKAEYDYGVTMPSLTDSAVSGEPTGTPTAGSPVRTAVNVYSVVMPADSGDDEPPDSPNGGYWQAVSNPGIPRIISTAERSEVRGGTATGTIYAVTEFDYDSGNPTNQRRWKSDAPSGSVGALGAGNSVETVTSYTSSGNVDTITHPAINTAAGPLPSLTKFTYDAPSGCSSYTDLYPSKRQLAYGAPEEREFSFDYDCYTGLPIQQTDVDNSVTATFGYDVLGRPTSTDEAGLRETHYTYNDAARTVTAESDRMTKGGADELVTITHYDAFGRVALTRTNDPNPPSGAPYTGAGIKTEARYFRGGAATGYDVSSNPFRSTSDPTMGWQRTKYDTSGRVIEIGYFDGSTAPTSSSTPDTGTVTTSYSANTTTVVDQGGVSRTSTTDALGRLVKVVENGISSTTCYTYDVLDNLIQVRQNANASCTTGGQVRTFTYDSLSRLRAATNPESGTITYEYDDNGNLIKRTDARGVFVEKYYDKLSRLTSNEYSDGTPTAVFDYAMTAAPQIGRLKKVYTVDVGERHYTYNALGQITNSSQVTGGETYPFSYSYNLDDSVASITYPSNRVVAYEYDAAGRALKAGLGTAASEDYLNATGIEYAPHGAPMTWQLGNGLVEKTTFNARLQPTQILLGPTATPVVKLDFGYGTTNNNGNVRSQTIAGAGIPTFNQTYTYDGANRLWTMSEASPSSLSRTFTYDAYGNRAVTGSQVSVAAPSLTTDFGSNNRMISSFAGYDSAGNQTSANVSGAQWSAGYDGENKQRYFCAGVTSACTEAVHDAEYVYDGEGNRVQKVASGDTVTYVYDAFGRLAAEYSAAGSSVAGRYFRTTDHLGSTRLVTDSATNVVSRRDFFPFGEQILAQSSSGRQGLSEYNAEIEFPQLFTAKERDDESGLDYFGARYMSASLGRFTSADAPFADQTPVDPQSWNLYAYVRNNPLRFIDPSGQAIELPDDEEERARVLAGLQESVGSEAGQYLYDNEYEGKHYVGIYAGGPQGDGPAFESINEASALVGGVITRPEVSAVSLVQEGTTVTNAFGSRATIGSIDDGRTPGLTIPAPIGEFGKPGGTGVNRAQILLTAGSTGSVPGPAMSNALPSASDLGTVLIHELGHASATFNFAAPDVSRDRSLQFENASRRTRGLPLRLLHDVPNR